MSSLQATILWCMLVRLLVLHLLCNFWWLLWMHSHYLICNYLDVVLVLRQSKGRGRLLLRCSSFLDLLFDQVTSHLGIITKDPC